MAYAVRGSGRPAMNLSRQWSHPWFTGLIGLLGLTATALVGYSAGQAQGVYRAQVQVYLLAPQNPSEPNQIAYTTEGLIATAGLVAYLVDPRGSEAPTSTQTSLLALGVRQGFAVRLPNAGGQWESMFNDPALAVEVVGPDVEQVWEQTTELLAQISNTVTSIQAADEVAVPNLIHLSTSPGTVEVHYYGGDAKRAMAVSLLLGLGLTWTAMKEIPCRF